MVDTDQLRTAFEDKYVGCKMYADEHLPEAATDSSLNQTFIDAKPPILLIPNNQLKDCQCQNLLLFFIYFLFIGNLMEYFAYRIFLLLNFLIGSTHCLRDLFAPVDIKGGKNILGNLYPCGKNVH